MSARTHLETLHGLVFEAPVEGVGLPLDRAGAAPEFSLAVAPPAASTAAQPEPLVARWEDGARAIALEVRGVGRFALAHGRVEVTPVPALREDLLRLFMRYHAVGLYARLRGDVVLHAAAVSLEGAAELWVGASGAGKTSAALEACARGARFFGDEVVVLRPSGEGFTVARGIPWPRVDAGAPARLHALARDARLEDAPELPLRTVHLAGGANVPGARALLAAQILGGYRPELPPLPEEIALRSRVLDAVAAVPR